MYTGMEIDTRENGEMVREKGKEPFGLQKKDAIKQCIGALGVLENGM